MASRLLKKTEDDVVRRPVRSRGRDFVLQQPPGSDESLTTGRSSRLFAVWTTRELVVAAVLSVAIGVIFWAWGLLFTAVFSLIPFPPQYVTVGLWMMGGLLVPYVIRRPGAAFFGEVVAAFVSMALGNQWGILTMASGLVQGFGAEVVFAAWRWRRFGGLPLYLAAALAGAFSIILDTFVWSYYQTYTWSSILFAAILCVVSSVILGGGLSQLLGQALARTGVLSGLEIAKGRVRRI
jgi:energy-coupling factor transport system permease protein